MESTYQHLWITEDGSKITDLWEVADDHKRHTCDKCRKERSAKGFVIYGSKYNPKLLRYVKSVMIIVEKKMKDEKEVSLRNNGTRWTFDKKV